MADGDLKWTYTTGGDARNQTPVIDSRGVTYTYPDGSILYAIKPDGSLLWSRNVGANWSPVTTGNVFVDYNGSIYVMNKAGLVTALYPDNTVMWTYDTAQLSYGMVSVDKNGVVYAVSIAKITAINPDGTNKWDIIYNDGTFYTPASIDNDGNVYASQWGYGTVCVDSDGNEKWKREFWNDDIIDPYATPSISADGNTIYITGETHNNDNVLLALNASDGTTNWVFQIVSVFTRTSYATPAIDSSGILYVGFNDNTVRAINPDGTEKWSITISANDVSYYSSPTVASDGTIYFIDYKTLYALDPSDGSEIWSYIAADTAIYTSPAIAQDGTVYFCSKDKKLYAIEASSPPLKDYRDYYTGIDQCYPSLWRNQVDVYQQWVSSKLGVGGSPSLLSPTIDRDGIIYVKGFDDKKLYAFNINGSEKWNYVADERIFTPPSIDNNGNIYIGTENGYVYKINSDGNFVWRFDVDSFADVWMQPTIDDDGIVYIGDSNGIFYAINSDGSEKWRYVAGATGFLIHAAALSLSGFVCFGDYDKNVYALNMSDGSEIWKYDAIKDIYSSPVIDSNDIVYVGSYDGVVHAINTDGTNKWTYNIGDNIYLSNAVLSSDESVLYIGAYDDVLYAINTNDGSLKWSYTCLHDIDSTANIRVDEKICIVDNKYLHVLNSSDGSLIWRYYIYDPLISSSGYNMYGIALARDGTIYIPIGDGRVYAILNTDLNISLPLHNRKDYFDSNMNFSAGISFNQPPPLPIVYTISGNVKDNKGYNINGVIITSTDDTSYETTTDSDGNYSQEVNPDEYNVEASLTGYIPDSADVDASSSDKTQDFILDRTTVRDKGIYLGNRYLLNDIVDN